MTRADAPAVMLRRPRGPQDAPEAARVHRASMRAAMPWLAVVHTPDEDLAWMRDTVFPTQSVWLACAGDAIVGVGAREGTRVMQLYVAPGWTGQGIGSRLQRMAGESAFLDLWAFKRNAGRAASTSATISSPSSSPTARATRSASPTCVTRAAPCDARRGVAPRVASLRFADRRAMLAPRDGAEIVPWTLHRRDDRLRRGDGAPRFP